MACTHFKVAKRRINMSYFHPGRFEFANIDDEADYLEALELQGV
jgi:hypothetical protein